MRPFELRLGDATDPQAARLTLSESGELALHQRNATTTCGGVFITHDDIKRLAYEFEVARKQEQ